METHSDKNVQAGACRDIIPQKCECFNTHLVQNLPSQARGIAYGFNVPTQVKLQHAVVDGKRFVDAIVGGNITART